MQLACTTDVYVPPGSGFADPYTALDEVLNQVDPARVKLNIVVFPTTVFAASYADIPETDVCVTLVLPVQVKVSDNEGDELNAVG